MRHYSPSHLCNLSLCPRFAPSEDGSEATDYGTLFRDTIQYENNATDSHLPS